MPCCDDIAKKEAVAQFNLGVSLTAQRKDDDAIVHLKKAVSLCADLVPAWNQLGDIYLRHEQYCDARDVLLQSISRMPEKTESNHRLGIAYFKLRDFENAKKQFEKVLILDYKHSEVNQYLANTLLEMGDHEKAMHFYFRQLENNPFFETFYNIGVLLMMKERSKEALHYFDQAIRLNPNDVATQLNCGNIYLKQNQLNQAILCYEKANALKPNDAEIQHILSALKQEKTPNTAPADYVTHLFDQYAPYYDKHLTEGLKYTVPEKMLRVIQLEYPNFSDKKWRILDLGCGTGLCGELFKPFASQLMGVDLSQAMLSAAKQKNNYDELMRSDVTQALTHFSSIDLILAADVFTYIGNLESTFKNAENALIQNGLFIFTVEKTHEKEFILQTSIRYAHSKTYLESLIASLGFDVIRFDNAVLRKQYNKSVEGYLVLLRKRLD